MSFKAVKKSIHGIQVPRFVLKGENDHKIKIYGVMGVGSDRFYSDLKESIYSDSNHPHRIYHYGINYDDSEKAIRHKNLVREYNNLFANIADLSLIEDVISFENYSNKDVDFSDLPDEYSDYLSGFSEKLIERIEQEGADKIVNILNNPIRSKAASLLIRSALTNDNRSKVVIETRADNFVKHLITEENGASLIVGTSVIPSVVEKLINNGYRVIDTKWVTIVPTLHSSEKPKELRSKEILHSIDEIKKIHNEVESE